MRNPFSGILLVLWFLLLYVIGLYYYDIRLAVGDSYETRVPDLSAFFTDAIAPKEAEVAPFSKIDSPDSVSITNDTVRYNFVTLGSDSLYPLLDSSDKVDTSTQRILLIGDSMAEALFYPFFNYCKWSNYHFKLIAIRGTSSPFWANTDTMTRTIKRYKPSLVLFTLGANEIAVPALMSRKRLYTKILRQLDSVPYLWIGTPVWTQDTVYRKLMKQLVPPDLFFDSQGMALQRQKDGAHPTISGSKVWGDSIARWMVYHSRYPVYFQLRKPPSWKKKVHIELPEIAYKKATDTANKTDTLPRNFKSKKRKLVLPDSAVKP